MTLSPDIDRHREALLRLVAMLLGIAGMEPGGAMRLSRMMRGTVLFYLRPMEAATVRLIAVLASVLERRGFRPKLRKSGGLPPKSLARRASSERDPVFALYDPKRRSGSGKLRMDGADHPPKGAETLGFSPSSDEPVDVSRLVRRLTALKTALADPTPQAERLLRLQAQREAALKPLRRPIRPGRPPGHRAKGRWDIDDLLRACHQMALHAHVAPNTS